MGTILIAGLRELGVHGVLPEEQTRPQPFEVDVELTSTSRPRATSDELDDTVDYCAVARSGQPGRDARSATSCSSGSRTRIAEVCRSRRARHRRRGHGAQAAPARAGDGRPRRGAHRAVTLARR